MGQRIGVTTMRFTLKNQYHDLCDVDADIPIETTIVKADHEPDTGYICYPRLPKDFQANVEHAMQAFAETLQASFADTKTSLGGYDEWARSC